LKPPSSERAGPRVRSLGERLHWYRHRLAAMSTAEIVHRVEEQTKRRLSRHWQPDFDRFIRADTLPVLPGLADGVRRVARDGDLHARWIGLRDDVRAGRLHFLNVDWPAFDGLPDWQLDPVTGRHWPATTYCFDIPYRHADAIGDVKYVWEIGRLQYLQPLAALAHADDDAELAALCLRHLESWIDANPPFRGVHWSSGIELALRVVSILVFNTLLGHRYPPELRRKVLRCLAAHGWWIYRYPSRFSSANNHLIAEAACLFLLGTFAPDLRGAPRWQAWGRVTLEREARLQFHADGVPAEQSPTYGAFSLEWLLLCTHLAATNGTPLDPACTARLVEAARFLHAVTDAGGHQPAIGDDDGGRVLFSGWDEPFYATSVLGGAAASLARPDMAPPRTPLQFRNALLGSAPAGKPLPRGVTRFPIGGYTVARERAAEAEVMLAFDHGPLGYLSIAAHGHADALGLWLHRDGRPVLVDAGTYLYHAGGDWRDHFRSTVAHNTLALRGLSSSRISGPFNWSAKAVCRVTAYDPDPDRWVVEAEHDGYVEIAGLRHRRRVALVAPGRIEVTDALLGDGSTEQVEIGFLFAPDLSLVSERGGSAVWQVMAGNRTVLRLIHEGPFKGWVERGMEQPKRGWYSPAFGRKVPAPRLVFAGALPVGTAAKFILEVS
jgi:hypothetical protein